MKGKYFILKKVQEDKFARELALIKENLPLHNSKILLLQPFIRNELLHVRERLKHSFLPEEAKHPIILPEENHVTKIISEVRLVSLTRKKYWIISCKSVDREVVNACLY